MITVQEVTRPQLIRILIQEQLTNHLRAGNGLVMLGALPQVSTPILTQALPILAAEAQFQEHPEKEAAYHHTMSWHSL